MSGGDLPKDTPNETRLTSAVVELIRELVRAFDQIEGPDHDASYARANYIKALQSVALFLEKVPTSQDFGHQFLKLATALEDLNQGTVHLLLRPSTVRSRPPDSTEMWMSRMKVAYAVELLLRSKMNTSEIKQLIDRDFPSIIHFAARSRSAGQASMTWHNMFVRGKAKNRIAAKVFERNLMEINVRAKPLPADTLRRVARDFLGQVRLPK